MSATQARPNSKNRATRAMIVSSLKKQHRCCGRAVLRTVLVAVCFGSGTPCVWSAKPDAKAGIDFFEQKIRPILVAHCYECHAETSKVVQANLYLDTREGMRRGGDSGPAIVPGKGGDSLLLEAIQFTGLEMPPKGKLPDAVIADFERWIEMGAPDPRDGKAPTVRTIDVEAGRKFWAYQPPRHTAVPEVRDRAWPRTDVDRFILHRLESEGLQPTDDADPATFMRRLYFDLIGLPPTPEEVEAFLRSCSPSPSLLLSHSSATEGKSGGVGEREQAYTAVVDRLLASPQFGERWGRHWLDVARYAESSGKERNVPYRMAWRYRDYVIDALNADLPYDQFIREQLAGDLLDSSSTAERDRRRIATGFLTIGPRPLTERIPEKYLLDVADEQLDVTCRVFLATTAACARCHDHKFDPIPTSDYYALIGIFRSTDNLCGVTPLRREFSYFRAAALGDEAERTGSARVLQDEIHRLETDLDKLNSAVRTATKKKDAAALEEAKRRQSAAVAQLAAARERAESNDPTQPRFAMVTSDRESPTDYAVRIRGEVDQLGPVVPRGFLSVLSMASTPRAEARRSGRWEMAEWIASRDNPLTARVFVNRVWHHLFGRGLVASTDDFGTMGERPSHPELLDHLALKFMNDGWSTKRLIRELVLSRAYRQGDARVSETDAAGSSSTTASQPHPAAEKDPDNRLLWRFSRRRLEAEAIRDAMLAVSGELKLERPYGSATLKAQNVELNSSARIVAADESPRYRAVYLPLFRGNVPEMLGLFDMADPNMVVGARETTTVATQALYLMNGKFVRDRARKFAERLLKNASANEARLDLAYEFTFARRPNDDEQRRMQEFLTAARAGENDEKLSELETWTDVCHALLSSAEFLYVR
jgi:cytochrome c553